MSGEESKEPDPKQSESTGADAKKAPESSWVGLLEGAAKALIPVFLTGASLIGFVAFAGAVIVWTRFDAIGVPPEQVVKAVPRNELVATGSSLLLLFGFFGVLAMLATYLVDRGGRATPGMGRALLLIVAAEGITAILLAEGVSMLSRIALILGVFLFAGLALVATFDKRLTTYKDRLRNRGRERGKAKRGPDSLHDDSGELRFSIWIPTLVVCVLAAIGGLLAILALVHLPDVWRVVAWFYVAELAVATLILLWGAGREIKQNQKDEKKRRKDEKKRRKREEEEKREELARKEASVRGRATRLLASFAALWHPQPDGKAEQASEKERLRRRRPHRLVPTFWGVCSLVGLAIFATVVPAVVLKQWWLAASFGAAFVLATGVWRVAILSKPSFVWYGLVVFISVPLFGTCTLMARNIADPQVEPMALIRSTDGPGEAIQGIYVTEGSDRVYFASVATEGCENEVTPNSGRLLWVPKSEVVAMSIGPLQDVDKAGKAALEMADALTPNIETPSGKGVSLSTAEESGAAAEGDGKAPGEDEPPAADQAGEPSSTTGPTGAGGSDEGTEGNEGDEEGKAAEEDEAKAAEEKAAAEAKAAEAANLDQRLASAGPAIRPNFGTGLKLVPAEAEPGDVVELRMSAPNTENGVNGFGEPREGFDLRLGGVRLAVLRVPVQDPARAEYVKTVGGRVLPLADYFQVEDEGNGEDESTTQFVRIKRSAVLGVHDANGDRGNFTLELAPDGKLALLPAKDGAGEDEPPTVTLPNGDEEQLEDVLLRRDWSPTKIKFRVPDDASSGVVSVECGQLGGQPVLDVVHPPVARIAVRVHPGTERLTFDSRRSSDESKHAPTRVWTVAGRRLEKKDMVSTELPPRLTPYEVSLTISDRNGLSDRVDLHIWRLPSSSFGGKPGRRPERMKHELRVRDALEEAMSEQSPAAIELDGHADFGRGDVGHSLAEAERLRALLFAPHETARGKGGNGTGGIEADGQAARAKKASDEKPLLNGGAAVPVLLRAFGGSCPIVRRPGPQQVNGRVEVFLLGPGATVGTGKHCHVARSSRVSW